MARHLKPLFVTAHINDKPITRVFVDPGAVLNVIPFLTLRKLGKSTKDLLPTKMKMSDFTGGSTSAVGVLIAEVTVGPKTSRSAFFVLEGKPSYNVLLRRDWIHPSLCVPSTLHQLLIFWIGDKVEMYPADQNLFPADVSVAKMGDATFYDPRVMPMMMKAELQQEMLSWRRRYRARHGQRKYDMNTPHEVLQETLDKVAELTLK